MHDGPVNRLETVWPTASSLDRGGIDLDALNRKTKSWDEKLASVITDHPQLALGAVAVCGLVLGWMVKRK